MKFSTAFLKDWVNPWREYVSEFVGVSIFVFLSSSVLIAQTIGGELDLLVTALGLGFSYVCSLYVTGHVSIGFLNPAVVISLWLTRRLPAAKATFYLLSQIIGSFCGTLLVYLVFGQRVLVGKFGAPMPGFGVNSESIMIVEFVLSAILVFFVFALAISKTAPSIFGPLVFGFYIVVATIIAYPLSGSSLNVVRSLGPLTFAHDWQYLIPYIASGIAGSLSGVLYEFIFLKKGKK